MTLYESKNKQLFTRSRIREKTRKRKKDEKRDEVCDGGALLE